MIIFYLIWAASEQKTTQPSFRKKKRIFKSVTSLFGKTVDEITI